MANILKDCKIEYIGSFGNETQSRKKYIIFQKNGTAIGDKEEVYFNGNLIEVYYSSYWKKYSRDFIKKAYLSAIAV